MLLLERVFSAIYSLGDLNNWWTKERKGDLDPNGKYRFYFSEEFDWEGSVSAVSPHKKFEIAITNSYEHLYDTN